LFARFVSRPFGFAPRRRQFRNVDFDAFFIAASSTVPPCVFNFRRLSFKNATQADAALYVVRLTLKFNAERPKRSTRRRLNRRQIFL